MTKTMGRTLPRCSRWRSVAWRRPSACGARRPRRSGAGSTRPSRARGGDSVQGQLLRLSCRRPHRRRRTRAEGRALHTPLGRPVARQAVRACPPDASRKAPLEIEDSAMRSRSSFRQTGIPRERASSQADAAALEEIAIARKTVTGRRRPRRRAPRSPLSRPSPLREGRNG